MSMLQIFYRDQPLRAVAIALVLAALAGSGVAQAAESATSRYPVTGDQRRVADQVAQAGVPLSALSPNAPDMLHGRARRHAVGHLQACSSGESRGAGRNSVGMNLGADRAIRT